MKKDFYSERYARMIVFVAAILGSHLAIVLFQFLVFNPFIFPSLDKDSKKIAAAILLSAWMILPVIVIFFALKKKYPEKVASILDKKRLKKIEELKSKISAEENRRKELIEQFREQYTPTAINCTNKPFGFLVKLSTRLGTIYRGETTPMLPEVTVNGISVGVEVYDETHLLCHVKKAVKSEEKVLFFKLGKNNVLEVKNPFYFDSSCKEEINWQGEGHANERKIFIPLRYFPQIVDGVIIPFTLKINNKVVGTYIGVLWGGMVVVSLNKDFHRSDCENKEVSLTLQYGNQAKIILPKPTVFVRNNQPVFSKN